MIISKSVTALVVVAIATACGAQTSRAGGDVAAGIIGGFAAGAIIGATAPRPYYGPAPVYVAPPPPPPAYVEPGPPPACYWTRGEPMWNGYAWVRPRVQVCD